MLRYSTQYNHYHSMALCSNSSASSTELVNLQIFSYHLEYAMSFLNSSAPHMSRIYNCHGSVAKSSRSVGVWQPDPGVALTNDVTVMEYRRD